jgi:cytidylate kinase
VSLPRSLDQLVDHQIRRWHLESQRPGPRPRRRCIALSRLPGSGAEELGKRLAERLGYAYFGVEIVDRIARKAGVQRELVEGMDERVRGSLEAILDGLRGGSRRFSESDYVHRLVRVITALGEGGSAVIVGRGSPFILGPERALRALVAAPREDRIERIAKRHDLPLAEASSRLEREDAARHQFVQRSFHVDPDDASLYDLAVNTGSLGIEGAADLLLETLKRRTGAGAGAGTFFA